MAEFWLPSEFLPDDMFVAEKTAHVAQAKAGDCFPREFGESKLSFPVETTPETESDEECMADLTRRMARSFLHGDRDVKSNYPVFSNTNDEGSIACSPQFPLCATGAWSPEMVPSPEVSSPDPTWDILLAAARQVVRMKEEAQISRLGSISGAGRPLVGLPLEPSPPPSANTTGYFAKGPHTHRQLQIDQFYYLKHRQMLKQKQQQQQQMQGSRTWGRQTQGRSGIRVDGSSNSRSRGGGGAMPLGSLSPRAWSSLQQHQHINGSGMRAVFLGTSGSASRKQSCGGTGVFLPRREGSPTDSRKKPACSTVLLPAKVVQALNINLEDMGGGTQPGFLGGFILDHETVKARNNALPSRKNAGGVNHHEVRREPSWAY